MELITSIFNLYAMHILVSILKESGAEDTGA